MAKRDANITNFANNGLILPPLSVINGGKVGVADAVNNILDFMFPSLEVIIDPTPGERNYQMRKHLKQGSNGWMYHLKLSNKWVRYIASDIVKRDWNCINHKCITWNILSEDPPEELRGDVFIYDPPFITQSRNDKRGYYYNISEERSINTIRGYYSRGVLVKLYNIVSMGGLIKGQDFYTPPTTDNFIMFLTDIINLENLRAVGFKVTGLFIYRFYRSGIHLIRWNIARSMEKKQFRRPVNTFSYYLVVKKQ